MNHVFNYSLTLKAVNQLYLNPLIALSPSKQMDEPNCKQRAQTNLGGLSCDAN